MDVRHLEECRWLIDAGAALHLLVTKDKMPVAKEWASAPVYTYDELNERGHTEANIGIRLGQPSMIDGFYLHLVDLDIRDSAHAETAWVKLLELWPDARSFPSVISGSGGESRHIYFLATEPYSKKKLAKSAGFSEVWNEKQQRAVKKNDWEIDILGTGAQAVLPPSIHPDTGLAYVWERPLNLEFPAFYYVESSLIKSWGASLTGPDLDDPDDDDLFSEIHNDPVQLEPGELDSILADLPEDWVDDRDQWLIVGAALHHQFSGSNNGFEKWCDWSMVSPKFDEKDSARVWKSFKGSRNPVRLPTLIQAARANRFAQELDFETETIPRPAEIPTEAPAAAPAPAQRSSTDLSDLLGGIVQSAALAPQKVIIDPDWQRLLHRNQNGELKSTLHNSRLIVANDARIAGTVAWNEFTQESVLRNPPKRVMSKRDKGKPVVNLEGKIWQVSDFVNGNTWMDAHDIGIRSLIEAPTTQGGYSIKISDRDLRGGVSIASHNNSFHPLRSVLEDCERRHPNPKPGGCETLFVRYLDCDDTRYNRETALMFMLGAVTRIFEPGHKFDFVPIIEGVQGKGKTTFVMTLGMGFSGQLTGDISNTQQMVEMMQGSWIIELGEWSSMARSDVNDLKAFISRDQDKARMAYAHRPMVFRRQCIFMGSTNDREYLKDPTRGRRYWPIICKLKGQIDNKALAAEVQELWAEAVKLYRELRANIPYGDLPLFLKDEAEAESLVVQESRRMESAEDILAGEIGAWLDKPIESDDGFDDLDKPPVYRMETCVMEIWREMMSSRQGVIAPHRESIMISKAIQRAGWEAVGLKYTKRYGRQRVFVKSTMQNQK